MRTFCNSGWLLPPWLSRAPLSAAGFAPPRLPARCPLLRIPPPPFPAPAPAPLPPCPGAPSPLVVDDELPFSDSLSALDVDELPDPLASWLSALSSEDD